MPIKRKPTTLEGHYAGFMTRFFAFVIDAIIVLMLLAVVSYTLTLISNFFELLPNPIIELLTDNIDIHAAYQALLPRIIPVVNILIIYSYFVFFWMSSGQTFGKALMGVRVVSVSGRPLTFLQAFFRFLIYPISALAFFLGFIWILIDNQRQGWHDTFARTYVIYSWRAIPHIDFLRQWQGGRKTE